MVANLKDSEDSRVPPKEPQNIFIVRGDKSKLLERSSTNTSFYSVAQLRTSKKIPVKKPSVTWLAIFLCLLAGLIVGAELYFYLTKGTLAISSR